MEFLQQGFLMNKVFKSVFLILFVLSCQFSVLGEEGQRKRCNSFIDGRTIVIDNDMYDDILIVFSKDTFEAYGVPSVISDMSQAQNFKELVDTLKHDEKMVNHYGSVGHLAFSKPNITFEYSSFVDLQNLFIEATKSIVLKGVIIESMDTILRGDIIILSQCIVEGNIVRLESNNNNASVYSITITFKDKSRFDIPALMFADIDFNNDKIGLFCSAVSKVEFKTNLYNYSVRKTNLTGLLLNGMLRFGSDMISTYEMFD